ncbi:Crp/Fnr family transcriptional regulator [Saccharothrix coeruleofusca]|uniref:CRP-like cAMP-binding protein n=1 Tax=Saccharothrix coeruleofusca TaxID=33919 RepID=A0A918AMX8_9PSEU|nr:Crp/Fnr family transcriptional regulator [Saccharothrix coeruleofusca]MBP2338446.1 CRP-like cAMP-binding protein [Saccharothrix coeruleofusca]GGP48294.1 hypothetical protein GCM10010185_20370 [Saccharothrix coeruleofusca]
MSEPIGTSGHDVDAVAILIEESSLGTEAARELRKRTSDEVAAAVMGRVEMLDSAAGHRPGRPGRWTAAPAAGAPAGAVLGQLALRENAEPAAGPSPSPSPGSSGSSSGWPPDSLLDRLTDRTRQELLHLGTVVRYGGDREVIEQDATDTHALLLLEGVVKVQTTDETGDTALLAIRSAGDLVGEMAALDRKPRSAAVVTCGEVVAKLIPSGELLAFLHRRNEVFVELIAMVNDRLRWSIQRRRDFLSHPAAERVARVLAELVQTYGSRERHGWSLGIPLTKVELASIAGMKPRTAEKAFSDLRKAGVVVSHLRRQVLVPDLAALREYAGL